MTRFVGMTVFEEPGREWVLAQARGGRLSFAPEDVGSRWSADVQACTERTERVDVVAINWRGKAILLGECKWGTAAAGLPPNCDIHGAKRPMSPSSGKACGARWRDRGPADGDAEPCL